MKTNENLRTITTSQSNLARALGLTTNRIQQLVKDGIVIRDENDKRGAVFVVDSIRNYDHMKSGTTDDNGEEINYMKEKAKHEAVRRKIAELKLAKMEHSVYDATTVEMVQTEMLSNLRTQLLGMPYVLAPQLEGKDCNEICEIMTQSITDKLMELSEYTPELYTNEETEHDDDEI